MTNTRLHFNKGENDPSDPIGRDDPLPPPGLPSRNVTDSLSQAFEIMGEFDEACSDMNDEPTPPPLTWADVCSRKLLSPTGGWYDPNFMPDEITEGGESSADDWSDSETNPADKAQGYKTSWAQNFRKKTKYPIKSSTKYFKDDWVSSSITKEPVNPKKSQHLDFFSELEESIIEARCT